MPAIFISYRREDSAGYAGRMHEELEGRLGREQVFRDADTLQAGQDFEQAIRQRLQHCQACLVLIGPNWAKSQTPTGERRLHQPGDYVCMEIAAALARPDVLVVPVLVGGATMPAADDLPESIRALRRRQAMSVRDEAWEVDMDRLAASLRQAVGLAPAPAAVANPPSRRRPVWSPRVVGAAMAVVLLVAAGVLWRIGGGASTPGHAGEPAGATNQSPDGATFAIDVPATASEISLGDLIY